MSGVRMAIEGADMAFAVIDGMAQRLARKEPLWRAVGEEIARQTNERFETSTGPDGQRWPESWRVKLAQGGGPTLVDRGILRGTLTLNVSEQGGEFGSPMEYAAPNQFGATITAKTSKGLRFKVKPRGGNSDSFVTKQSVTIPARPFLGLNEENLDRIGDVAEGYVLGLKDAG